MNSRKLGIFLALFITLVLAGGALFLGIQLNKETNISPNETKAAAPLNCDLDKTTANPKNDPNSGNIIPEYCPGATGKFKVLTPGKLYLYLSRNDLTVKVNNVQYENTNGLITTNLTVKNGDYVAIYATVNPNTEAGIGWINPVDVLCGGIGWPTVSIQPLLTKVSTDQRIVVERQCWGTIPTGSGDFAFNNFQIIAAVESTIKPTVPPATLRPTNTPIYTPVIVDTTVKACGASSSCSSDANCDLGNSCFAVNGSKRCVATMCITGGILNDVCEADLCTAKQRIDIQKTVSVSCVTGQNKKRLSYKIVLTNPTNNQNTRTGLSVIDTLDSAMQSSYIQKTSIPFSGVLLNGQITWNFLSLKPSGGKLEIKYDAIIPPSEYGKEFINTVVVTEGSLVRGSETIKHKIEVLPCTALISDEIDKVLIGMGLVILGITFYALSFDKKLGKILWHIPGIKTMAYRFEGKEYNSSFDKMQNEEFEKKIRRAK